MLVWRHTIIPQSPKEWCRLVLRNQSLQMLQFCADQSLLLTWHNLEPHERVLIRICIDQFGLWVWKTLLLINIERLSPLWAASFPRQGVLDCIGDENTSWKHSCKQPYFSLLLTKDVLWLTTWVPTFTPRNDGFSIVRWINTFFLKLLFIRLFYHRHRNELRTNPYIKTLE